MARHRPAPWCRQPAAAAAARCAVVCVPTPTPRVAPALSNAQHAAAAAGDRRRRAPVVGTPAPSVGNRWRAGRCDGAGAKSRPAAASGQAGGDRRPGRLGSGGLKRPHVAHAPRRASVRRGQGDRRGRQCGCRAARRSLSLRERRRGAPPEHEICAPPPFSPRHPSQTWISALEIPLLALDPPSDSQPCDGQVRALLEHGADPNTSFLNHSALALAVRCCSSQATTALLEARANVDNKDPQGWTALMHAIDAHEPAFSREHVLVQRLVADRRRRCLRTAPQQPSWWRPRLSSLLLTPKRILSRPLSTTGAAA